MTDAYRHYFGMSREPFPVDLPIKDIFHAHDLEGVTQRFQHAVRLGAIALITGEVGAGKSTALRYAASSLHPSEYKILYITAGSGSILEFYRQLLDELGINVSSNSRAVMTRLIKQEILDLSLAKKLKPVLMVDEASLMRLEVFAEIHTLLQFEKDSKPYLPVILVGQRNLVDKLMYRTSLPLASRIVARSHLEGSGREEMEAYLNHHLRLAGVKNNLFEDAAVTAIYQDAGGLFRKANHLAKGALIAAIEQKSQMVNPDHVRIASTEIF